MSAFIVDPEHINVLIWAGLQHVPGSAPLRWRFGNPTDLAELTPATATHVGRMLLEENTASVNHLYNEHHAPNLTYTYRPPPAHELVDPRTAQRAALLPAPGLRAPSLGQHRSPRVLQSSAAAADSPASGLPRRAMGDHHRQHPRRWAPTLTPPGTGRSPMRAGPARCLTVGRARCARIGRRRRPSGP
jgi:hypothetical protein